MPKPMLCRPPPAAPKRDRAVTDARAGSVHFEHIRSRGRGGGNSACRTGYVGIRGAIQGDAVTDSGAQKCGVNKCRAGGVDLGQKPCGRSRRDRTHQGKREAGADQRLRGSGDIRVAGLIDGDGASPIVAAPAQKGRVEQRGAGGIEFRHKCVGSVMESVLRSSRGNGESCGVGVSGDIRIAGTVYGDAAADIDLAATKNSRIERRGAGGIHLDHEHISAAARSAYAR